MIYLDNAASTSVDVEVLESYQKFVKEFYGNPASVHGLGIKSADLELKARRQIASIFNVKENDIIFTSGATESNNLAIKGAALYYKERGNHLITSKVEHPSVLEAFKQLEEEFGFDVTYLDVDKNGFTYTIPKTIQEDATSKKLYEDLMKQIDVTRTAIKESLIT